MIAGSQGPPFKVIIGCLCLLSPDSALRAQANPADSGGCASQTSEVPSLSPSLIGHLRLDEPLGRLRHLCGAAQDTTVPLRGDAGPAYPGVSFHFDSLVVIALQYGASGLDSSRAADGWLVSGTRATIQGKVPMSASWSALHAALGTPQVNARAVLAIRFCSFPNAIFTLNADPGAVVTRNGRVDLSSIPSDATIHHVFIMSRSLASHLLGC